MESIAIDRFLELTGTFTAVDVRSPGEFTQGHMPGSVNIPLFSDEERAIIGTAYKKEGPSRAVLLGEGFAEPKKDFYLRESRSRAVDKTLLVLCARGGMRSEKFSEFLESRGFRVYRLKGGYKSYRRRVLDSFTRRIPLRILGGKTGCGKTDILMKLAEQGEPVIDLEGLANHKGSAFGSLGMGEQPSTEQFENALFHEVTTLGTEKSIWVEDESLNIGRVFMPREFYDQMKASPLILLEMSRPVRIARLCADYGQAGIEPLVEAMGRIRKRLGDERFRDAVSCLKDGRPEDAASLVLSYYDKCYDYDFRKKNRTVLSRIQSDTGDLDRIIGEIRLLDL